jgi:hypothetical protein
MPTYASIGAVPAGPRVGDTQDVTEQPRSILRDVLAAALRNSTDPLADEALNGLTNNGVAEEVPTWEAERADLLATYEGRVERTRRGEGPATRRSDEYIAVLAAPTTPDRVEEVGWASGKWFYVALLHAGTVLALCTVARAVWHIDEAHLGWHAFGVGSGFKDVDLIKNALDGLGDDTEPHAFRPVQRDLLSDGGERIDAEGVDAWYEAETPTGTRVVALDHTRARLFLSARD